MLKDKGYDVNIGGEISIEIKDADGVLTDLDDKVDQKFIETGSNLKIIANYAVGYDNIDVATAKEHNIYVTNTPDVLTEAVAEHTFGLMLTLARRISEADRYIRADKWHDPWAWNFMLGTELKGKTLGIIGPGRIGSRVGQIAEAFGMKVMYCGSKDDPGTFVSQVDFVSVHVPLLDSTRHLINQKLLKKMKSSAYLINTSRGAVVDEPILAQALKECWIKGAALDVFEKEPNVNNDLLKLENVVLTPHIASATEEARTNMAKLAATNIIEALEGRIPPNVVK